MKRKLYYVIVAIQVLIVGGLFSYQSLTSILGTSITLKASTYDPRDLLRGEYVNLTYDHLNQVSIETWKGNQDFNQIKENSFYKKRVYAILKKEQGYDVLDYITDEKPKNGEVYLKGRLTYIERWNEEELPSLFHVEYGIEDYYVKENTAVQYEGKGNLVVKAKVWNGNVNVEDVSEK